MHIIAAGCFGWLVNGCSSINVSAYQSASIKFFCKICVHNYCGICQTGQSRGCSVECEELIRLSGIDDMGDANASSASWTDMELLCTVVGCYCVGGLKYDLWPRLSLFGHGCLYIDLWSGIAGSS